MPVTVATADDLAALAARVSVLEAAAPAPAVVAGVQAKRISGLVEAFGVNTYSSASATANMWGTWPSDYSAATVIAALNWLTAGSGLSLLGREYHYAGREAMQGAWLKQVVAATATRFSMCIGENGSVADVASMLSLAADQTNGIAWLEGINEPNSDFGSGILPLATVEAAQAAIFAGAPTKAVGPSIVFGLPDPEAWLGAYVGAADLAVLLPKMAYCNAHFYPPTLGVLDDGSGRGGAIDDVVAGLAKVYPGMPPLGTEYHPSLYNMATPKIAPGGTIDAYYMLLDLLSANRLKLDGLWWYALLDWKDPTQSGYMPCGLFPKDATAPRPAAYAIRALCSLTGDKGPAKRTFAPGVFAYSVAGLPAPINAASPHTGGHHDLYQSSDGRFFLLLWNAQVAPGGAPVPVTVSFPNPPATVSEFNLSLGTAASTTPVQALLARPTSVVSHLDAGVRLLVIAP